MLLAARTRKQEGSLVWLDGASMHDVGTARAMAVMLAAMPAAMHGGETDKLLAVQREKLAITVSWTL